MEKNHLVITLAEEAEDMPIVVVKSYGVKKFALRIIPEETNMTFIDNPMKKYALVWKQNGYEKIAFDDILWIKADGSYCTIHLKQKCEMTVSFHIAIIEKELPVNDFVRIHRSFIVNLRHVESLIGNSLKVADTLLSIGREYKETVLRNFVFIGVRRSKK